MSVSLIKAGGYGTAGARLPLVAVINPALIVGVLAGVGAWVGDSARAPVEQLLLQRRQRAALVVQRRAYASGDTAAAAQLMHAYGAAGVTGAGTAAGLAVWLRGRWAKSEAKDAAKKAAEKTYALLEPRLQNRLVSFDGAARTGVGLYGNQAGPARPGPSFLPQGVVKPSDTQRTYTALSQKIPKFASLCIVVVSAAVGAVGGVWYFGQVVTLKKKSKAMRLDRQGQLQQHVM